MAEELKLQIDKFKDDFDKDEERDLISFTEGRFSEELPESFKIFLKDLASQLKKINWSADIDTDLDVAKNTIRQLYRQKKENLRKKLIKKNKKNVPPPPPPPPPTSTTVPREELLHRLHQKFKKPSTVAEMKEMNDQRALDNVNNQLQNTGL